MAGGNGLFRVNASGSYNVPAGRYDRPKISDRGTLLHVAEALSAPRVRLQWGSFESTLDIAEADDFLYVDPPYAPVSATENFTSCTAPRFTQRDQERLQQVMIALATRGCHVLMSHSTADEIAALYDQNAEARGAGLHATRVPARRAMNSNGAGRGPVLEYLITTAQREGFRPLS